MTEQGEIKSKDKDKTEDGRTEEVVKITVTKEAETKLMQVLERVNEGFDAGRINRQQLASWALNQFADGSDADQLRVIRHEHVDEFAFLESIIKRSREAGKLPQEIRNAIKAQLGVEFQPKRAAKKSLTPVYTNDVVRESEEDQKTA